MGLLWKSVEPEVEKPQVIPRPLAIVSPLTHQEWNIFFESHPALQVNPSDLTQNIEVINNLRERTLSERFAEIARSRSRVSNTHPMLLKGTEPEMEFVVTQVNPNRVREGENNANERLNDQ